MKDNNGQSADVRSIEKRTQETEGEAGIRPEDEQIKDLIGNTGFKPTGSYIMIPYDIVKEKSGIQLPENQQEVINRVTILEAGPDTKFLGNGQYIQLHPNALRLMTYSTELDRYFVFVREGDVVATLDPEKE